MNRKNIIVIMVASVLALLPASVLRAQVQGSPLNTRNALDFRYQKFNGTLPKFNDSTKFQDKIYTTISSGIGTNWELTEDLDNYKTTWDSKFGIGYRLSPVHAIEAEYLWSKNKTRTDWGVNLNYAFNINNFALRRDNHNKMEAILVNGLSYRKAAENHFGINTGEIGRESCSERVSVRV